VIGTVTEVRWAVPHVTIRLDVNDTRFVDVQDSTGAVETCLVELGSPGELMMFGWTSTLVKPGDQITVDGWLARNDRQFVNARSVMLPNGREMFAASSFFYFPGTSSVFPAVANQE
jgi:hypothetical protein